MEDKAVRDDPQTALSCPRCRTLLAFAGTKRFHEGALFWGLLGGVFELLKNREHLDVYVCPRCGRVELFLEGVGEDLRDKPPAAGDEEGPYRPDPFEGFDLLTEAAELERGEEWDRALTAYQEVLKLPSYSRHHEYARRRIQMVLKSKGP